MDKRSRNEISLFWERWRYTDGRRCNMRQKAKIYLKLIYLVAGQNGKWLQDHCFTFRLLKEFLYVIVCVLSHTSYRLKLGTHYTTTWNSAGFEKKASPKNGDYTFHNSDREGLQTSTRICWLLAVITCNTSAEKKYEMPKCLVKKWKYLLIT